MKIGFITIAFLSITAYSGALNFSTWNDISDGIEGEKLVDMYITDDNCLLVANENGLYKSIEGSRKWERIFFINSEEKIVDIIGTAKRIFIGTKHKVYTGELDKMNLQEIFSLSGENEIMALELSSSQQYLYIGTQKGLWTISLKINGERRFFAEVRDIISLRAHPFKPDILFTGTEEGLYRISKKESKLLYTSISKNSARVNAITISKSNDDIIFIATDTGLLRMRLKDKELRHLKLNGKIFYVETFDTGLETVVALGEKNIFHSQKGLDKWNTVMGVIPYGIPLKILRSPSGTIYLLTSSGIFKSEENYSNASSLKEIENIFSSEPSIEEMERVVLKAYMLDKNIIKRWRRNSRLKALLPEIDISVTRGIDSNYDYYTEDTIYTSSSGRYYIGPDERKLSESYGRDLNYGIKLSWKLGDAIFNNSELSVSDEAEDILDFRYRILSDLRRVYFERKRVIAELHFLPAGEGYKKFELKNRIEELNAYLDMLSDGYFSKNIKNESGN